MEVTSRVISNTLMVLLPSNSRECHVSELPDQDVGFHYATANKRIGQ
jgi:hypothetical protein